MPSKLDQKCLGCSKLIARQTRSGYCQECYNGRRATPVMTPTEQVARDRERERTSFELSTLKQKYAESLKTIREHERSARTLRDLELGTDQFTITPTLKSDTAEGTAVLVASDWHVEERVGPEVGGLNKYSLDIAKSRVSTFFSAGLRLIKLLQQDITINTTVLALLGDFISNDIHDEFPEINAAQPNHALVLAQNMIISGIKHLLQHSSMSFVVPCHSGNHARTTKTTRFGAENGHSLEYLMYLHLAAYFKDESRVTFIVPDGMHSYLQMYDTMIRFQHGHAIRYGGGVGGIYIPVNKAIAQWNKGRHADLDVFGHFHQLRDGGNFICNGSLIGYNSFALSIKADYEPPKQALFLMDKKRGRTCTWPILVK